MLVAVFGGDVGEQLLGFHSTRSIVSGLPAFLSVVPFPRPSMDYHVFILRRVCEAMKAARRPTTPARSHPLDSE